MSDPVLEHQLLNPSGHDQSALSCFDHLLDQADYFEQELKRTGVNKWLLRKGYATE